MYRDIRDYTPLIEWITASSAESNSFLITLIDIDHFNSMRLDLTVDDRMGLIQKTLQSYIPQQMLYLGLDELAFVTRDVRFEDCVLQMSLAKKALSTETSLTFTASLGEYPKHGEDPIEFMRHLEETLFQAKKAGRDRISSGDGRKMKLKSNYYTLTQFERLTELSQLLHRSEASLLREALDLLLRKYEQ